MTRGMVILMAVVFGSAGSTRGQTQGPQSQKSALLEAIQKIELSFSQLRRTTQDPGLLGNLNRGSRSLGWLRSAANSWQPATPDEGKDMLESLAQLIGAIPEAPDPKLSLFVEQAADDLESKVEHCQQYGLADRPKVQVVPKRSGAAEVKGLQVVYLEKFVAVVNPTKRPHEFPGMSPATDSIVPGIYFFWARNPEDSTVEPGKEGPRKEQTVAKGQPTGPIEVVAP